MKGRAARKLILKTRNRNAHKQGLASDFVSRKKITFFRIHNCLCGSVLCLTLKDLFFRYHNNGEDYLSDNEDYRSGVCFRCKNCYRTIELYSDPINENYEEVADYLKRKLIHKQESDDGYKFRRTMGFLIKALNPLEKSLEEIGNKLKEINDTLGFINNFN